MVGVKGQWGEESEDKGDGEWEWGRGGEEARKVNLRPEKDDEHAHAVEGPTLLPELGYEVLVEVTHVGPRDDLTELHKFSEGC